LAENIIGAAVDPKIVVRYLEHCCEII